MAKQVQWRKGTTAQHKSFVGANGEITIDTDKKTVVVHDGVTPGGSVQATEKYVNDAVSAIDVSSYTSKDYIDGLDSQNVKLTGNQTIAGVKTFSSTIDGNITGNSGTATKLATAQNIALTGDVTGNGNFDGTGNLSIATTIAGNAPSATKLETARNIALTGAISGSTSFDGSDNVTISAQVNDNSHNHTSLSGTVRFAGSTGDSYNTSNIMVEGNGATDTVKATIGFYQPGMYAGTLSMLDPNMFQFKKLDGSPAILANHITGNSQTATKLATDRGNYNGSTNSVVVGELMWKNYGNNHTIFDASNSTSPTGAGVNNTNPDVPWSPTYPTLMGYNSNTTFGVRVDSSRYADQLYTARTISLSGAVTGSCVFNGSANINIATSSSDNSAGEYALVTVAAKGTKYSNQNVAGSNLKELYFANSSNDSFALNGYNFYPTGRSLTGTWFVQGVISNGVAGYTGINVALAKRIA